jgi:hypothetical protein
MALKRSHPLNSPDGISSKWWAHCDIGNNIRPLDIVCHVVYAMLR